MDGHVACMEAHEKCVRKCGRKTRREEVLEDLSVDKKILELISNK
jgi:hypothetical protein